MNLDNLNKVLTNLNEIVYEAILDVFTNTDIEQLVRDNLSKGMAGDERVISVSGRNTYSESYARYRQSLGLQTRVIDLNLTGSFYESISAVLNDNQIVINADFSNVGEVVLNVNKVLQLPTNDIEAISERVTNRINEIITQRIR